MEAITSLQNPRVKQAVSLGEKSRERRSSGLFTVEGQREIMHCIEGGFEMESAFFCASIIAQEKAEEILAGQNAPLIEVNDKVYAKMAYREGTEGIIAVFKSHRRELSEFKPGENPFVIVLESVEKPGNLGAILRTADASGAAAVIVCDPLTDLYNPNLIRASIGGIFTVPTFACTSEEAYNWLTEHNFQILTAQLQDSRPYYDVNFLLPTAAIFGTESTGLTSWWRERSHAKINIPMLGRLDSLNVSVSAAVLAYESVRQKLSK
ncbi:MAG: RNA methyltransferase [Bacteroidales bacterium]|nr:RNA methyltransferase [Bacteroidales bacterium]